MRKIKPNEKLLELGRIAAKNGGLLLASEVVKAAKAVANPLHDEFTWDDRKAAQERRLDQARGLIQQYWTAIPPNQVPVRMLLSLKSDRKQGGGYRSYQSVLDDPERRAELVQMALDDLSRWQRSYAALTELRPVMAAIERVLNRLREVA